MQSRTMEIIFSTEPGSVFHSVLEETLRRVNTIEGLENIDKIEWPWKVTQVPVKLHIEPDTEVHRLDYNDK